MFALDPKFPPKSLRFIIRYESQRFWGTFSVCLQKNCSSKLFATNKNTYRSQKYNAKNGFFTSYQILLCGNFHEANNIYNYESIYKFTSQIQQNKNKPFFLLVQQPDFI